MDRTYAIILQIKKTDKSMQSIQKFAQKLTIYWSLTNTYAFFLTGLKSWPMSPFPTDWLEQKNLLTRSNFGFEN